MRRFAKLLVTFALLATPAVAEPSTHLFLVGGGELPKAGLTEFAALADRGPGSRILVVDWATSEPAVAFANAQEEFAAVSKLPLVQAPTPPLDAAARATLLQQLKDSTAVFFTGGAQTRIMDVLHDRELLEAFRARFAAGVPMGGSSAGCEAMAHRMITGEGDFTTLDAGKVETTSGVGLLPAGMLVDMHFVRRQRENRLFALLLAGPESLGLGIDQDTAVMLTDGHKAEVSGAGTVMVIRASQAEATLNIKVLKEGETAELR